MEDAHTCLLELSEDKDASFFAVFDGHGGHDVAKAASINLHKTIVNNKSYREFLPHSLLSVQWTIGYHLYNTLVWYMHHIAWTIY